MPWHVVESKSDSSIRRPSLIPAYVHYSLEADIAENDCIRSHSLHPLALAVAPSLVILGIMEWPIPSAFQYKRKGVAVMVASDDVSSCLGEFDRVCCCLVVYWVVSVDHVILLPYSEEGHFDPCKCID